MLVKTPGIVLKNTKYSDSSVISKIYTRQLGIQTYMINGVRSPKAAIKPSLLQPLVILDMVVYSNPIKEIHRIKECRPSPALHTLHFDVIKSTVGLYMAELLYKTVREEEPNENLFDFAAACILALDDEENAPVAIMPVYFALQLSAYLGFFPRNNFSEAEPYFNLQDGSFTAHPAGGEITLQPEHSAWLSRLCDTSLDELKTFRVPRFSRVELMDKMMDYYRLHHPNFHSLNALNVLAGVMKE